MPEVPNHNNRPERYIRYALVILALILLALLIFVGVQYYSLRQQQIVDDHIRLSQFLSRHAPLAPSDAGIIHTWMTFDYINRVFALPPAYLKDKLQITDTHYPRITVGALLSQVESAVREYVAAPAITPTSTPVQHATTTSL